MRYIKFIASDNKNGESATATQQKPSETQEKPFEILTETPDIILRIAEFFPSSEEWFGYHCINRRTREIVQGIFEKHVRDCILRQCKIKLLECKNTLTDIEFFVDDPLVARHFVTNPFVADVCRINFIVYDGQHNIVLNTARENIPFGTSHQTVNEERLQTISRQVDALSSNSNRKIPLMYMQLLAHKYKILAMILIIIGGTGIAMIATESTRIIPIIVGFMLLLFSCFAGLYICTKAGTGGHPLYDDCQEDLLDDGSLNKHKIVKYKIQKNSQNALAANVIKTGRIAVSQSDDSDLKNVAFNLYIPQNILTFFQSKNGGDASIIPGACVIEIPTTQELTQLTPEREPGANGSEVTNEIGLLALPSN